MSHDPKDELEWMAVAQHHGLNTKLLDWSESPTIAAYFAVENSGIIEKMATDAALYGVPCPRAVSTFDDFENATDIVAYFPPHLTPRITVQRSVFTAHKCPEQCWSPPCLVKWRIPANVCFDIKLALNRAGVNHASLFPDLDGIANNINWLYKWELV